MGNSGSIPLAAAAQGAPVWRHFPFSAALSPGLFTVNGGWSFYTPTPGDLLLDIYVEVDTVNSTVACLDISDFVGGVVVGVFRNYSQGSAGLNMGQAVQGNPTGSTILGYEPTNGGTYSYSLKLAAGQAASNNAFNTNAGGFSPSAAPLRFSTADPLKAIITQSGQLNGLACTHTDCVGTIYLETVTPL